MTKMVIDANVPMGVFFLRRGGVLVWTGGWADYAPLEFDDELILGIEDYRTMQAQFREHTLQ